MLLKRPVVTGFIKRLLPFKNALRRAKRGLTGYQMEISNLRTTVDDVERIVAAALATGVDIEGARVLEIGSGWFPTLALLLRLKGARHVTLTDINAYLDEGTFLTTRDFLLQNSQEVCVRFGLDEVKAVRELRSWGSIAGAGLTYICPFDEARVPNGSIDLVVSRTVLEHVPPRDITKLHRQLVPKLRREGQFIHVVDESDHMEHGDKSISRVHFLTLPPATWNVVNWCCDYQNRLRHSQFIPLFQAAGLEIEGAQAIVDGPTKARVRGLDLKPPFDDMGVDEIATLTSVFVLRPRLRADELAGGAALGARKAAADF